MNHMEGFMKDWINDYKQNEIFRGAFVCPIYV